MRRFKDIVKENYDAIHDELIRFYKESDCQAQKSVLCMRIGMDGSVSFYDFKNEGSNCYLKDNHVVIAKRDGRDRSQGTCLSSSKWVKEQIKVLLGENTSTDTYEGSALC